MFEAKVVNFRQVSLKGVVGFFDVQLGVNNGSGFEPLVTLFGYALKPRKVPDQYWIQPASKPRMRNGEHVTDDKGYKVYDPHFDFYVEDTSTGGKALTRASKALRDQIVEQATAAYTGNASVNKGRGKAAATATANAVFGNNDNTDQDDDDLPF